MPKLLCHERCCYRSINDREHQHSCVVQSSQTFPTDVLALLLCFEAMIRRIQYRYYKTRTTQPRHINSKVRHRKCDIYLPRSMSNQLCFVPSVMLFYRSIFPHQKVLRPIHHKESSKWRYSSADGFVLCEMVPTRDLLASRIDLSLTPVSVLHNRSSTRRSSRDPTSSTTRKLERFELENIDNDQLLASSPS